MEERPSQRYIEYKRKMESKRYPSNYYPTARRKRNKQRVTYPTKQNIKQIKRVSNRYKRNNSIIYKIAKSMNLAKLILFTSLLALTVKELKTTKITKITPVDSSGPSSNKLSAQGRKNLMNYEAFRANAYKLPGEKYWTIGYGHSGPDVHQGDTITKEEAEKLFEKDVSKFESTVSSSVKVPITQNMFDALVSFTYNAGSNAFKSSTLLKKLNKGDYKGAQQEFTKWVYVGKTYNEGLYNRRIKEAQTFGKDISSNNTLNAPTTKVTKPIRTTGNIGKYKLAKGVKISQPMKVYLSETGGEGTITSGIRGVGGKKSHASGNKIDVGLGGKTQEEIIKTVVPFMKNPNTLHVAFECLGKNDNESKQISKNIASIIFQRYPDIYTKVKKGQLKIYHWGWEYGTGPHVDILIDPTNLESNKSAYNLPNSKEKLALVDKAYIPEESTEENITTKYTPKIANLEIPLKDKNVVIFNEMDKLSPVQTYRNTNNVKFS